MTATSESRTLEVFYDHDCPWCYLGAASTDRPRLLRRGKGQRTLAVLEEIAAAVGLRREEVRDVRAAWPLRGRSEGRAAEG